MRRLVFLVFLVLAMFTVPALAQEPEPEPEGPGQEQPGEPAPEPQPEPQPVPPGEVPGGQLPRTGLEAFQLFFLGIVLLLGGARLRVVALRRKRRVPGPIHAQRHEWAFPDPGAPAPTGLLPSTASARRLARAAGGDRLAVDRFDLVGVAVEGLDERPARG
jgi:hypothetical protein